jgi:hypothetical protein
MEKREKLLIQKKLKLKFFAPGEFPSDWKLNNNTSGKWFLCFMWIIDAIFTVLVVKFDVWIIWWKNNKNGVVKIADCKKLN